MQPMGAVVLRPERLLVDGVPIAGQEPIELSRLDSHARAYTGPHATHKLR